MFDFSVDAIGTRIYSYQQDKINKLYDIEVPNWIMINRDDENRGEIVQRCAAEGQPFSNITAAIADTLAVGTTGYSAADSARTLLYQYTNYSESISITSVPIYYLEVNTRITVNDSISNIYGDYIIDSINLSFTGNTMTISATRALDRI